VHGTTEIRHLGKPASHGCVRLAPENAGILFALVKEKGLENTEIVLNGDLPKSEANVASAGTRKHEAKPGKKSTKTARVRKPSREFADRRFERRSTRRGWARFFLSPPPGYYVGPPGQGFFMPGY